MPCSAGDKNVVEGLDLAMLKTNAKETVELMISPEYGYGAEEHKGSVGVVPPKSTLHYTLELLEVEKVRRKFLLSYVSACWFFNVLGSES
jgi:FKBP-type peptidyl-prolyl cis-trans isomerase